jgi:hypothetical protein
MSYFSKFPLTTYDIKGNDIRKLLPDILRRVKLKSVIKSGGMLFDKYDVKEGEKPEDIAFKWFGDPELHWVILMTNNVTDRYYGWPMNQVQFAEYITDKYGDNVDAVHHYEVTKDSGRTTSNGPSDYSHLVEVNSDTDNAISISNRQYEEREQDKKRQIQLLNKSFLGDFIDEFDKLIAE